MAGIRLEEGVAVLERDLDAVDELHALVAGLDVLGRELGARGDEGDASLPHLAVVGHDLGLLAEPQAGEVGLRDVRVEPGVPEVGHGEERRSRGRRARPARRASG